MSQFDAFRFDGKRVLVVGGASGMGAAAAALAQDAGADVIVMDFADITLDGAQGIHVNLAEQASIDEALAQVEGPIHALMACAGVADGTPGIERINFIGHRYLIDQVIADGRLGRGGAIGFISSAAGLGWESNLTELKELLDTKDWEEASAWMVAHNKADYMNSKQAICAYVACSALDMLRKGIRINAICPGPTETPLAVANKETWLAFGQDFRDDTGIDASTPLEQAYPLLFVCSDAAVSINGITLVTDAGYMSAGITESFPSATPVAQFLMGRLT